MKNGMMFLPYHLHPSIPLNNGVWGHDSRKISGHFKPTTLTQLYLTFEYIRGSFCELQGAENTNSIILL